MQGRLNFFRVWLLALLLPVSGHAVLDGASRIGADIKMLMPSGNVVMLYGWRFLYNPSEAFSIGGTGYTGQMTGAAQGSFSYGGLAAAYNLGLTQSTRLEFGLLAGGGGGFDNTGTQVGGVVVEPSLSIAFSLGRSVGSAITGGYMWMPTSSNSSGVAVGLRFEFFADRAPAPAAAAQ